MAPFLLLFLLFSLPQSTEGVVCCKYCTCLHFITYYYNNFEPVTKFLMDYPDEASLRKLSTNGQKPFLSTLQVVSPSASLLNVSFTSDIPSAYLYFEKGGMKKIDGERRGKWHTVPYLAIFGFPVTINVDKKAFREDVPFWPNVKAKLPCNSTVIRDACNNGGHCDKVLVSPRSVSCKSSFQLHLLSSSSGQWLPVTAVSCQAARWNFVLSGNKIKAGENMMDVICRKAETKPTSAPTTSTVAQNSTDAPPSPHKPTAASPSPRNSTAARAATSSPHSTSSPPPSATQKAAKGDAKREAKEGHHSNKWLWIGGAIVLVMISFGIVAACIVFRSRRSKHAVKNKKTAGGNKKNKGGKKDDSSNQPSTSESKYDQDKQVSSHLSSHAPPSSESVMQPATVKGGEVSVYPTTNVEMLKTEML